MEFTFKLSREDWKSYLRVANKRLTKLAKANAKLFFTNLVAWLALGFAMATYIAMYRKYPPLTYDLNVVAAVAIVGAVLLVGSFIYKQWLYQTVAISAEGALLTPQIVEANAQTISFKNSFGNFTYSWHRFLDRAEDDARIYLFIDNAMALIIPKAAVPTSEQLTELLRWARLREP